MMFFIGPMVTLAAAIFLQPPASRIGVASGLIIFAVGWCINPPRATGWNKTIKHRAW
jgi:hypothetical protein